MQSKFSIIIKPDLQPVLVLTDNLNMPVPQSQFENVLKTFHAGSMFYLNAEMQPTNIKGATQMVTPMVFKQICLFSLIIFFKYLS